jgi:predicted regulator of Ras-like GTPase activity (Roadblock/LC7/MglB family)
MTTTDVPASAVASASPVSRLRACVADLAATPGVAGAVISTIDGQVAVAEMANGQAALAAALMSSTAAMGQSFSGLLGPAPFDELIVSSADGTIVVTALGTNHLIAVLGTTTLNMGAVRLITHRLVSELVSTISGND